MSRDSHDALIEQLLREFLGGDRPRDLTVRTLERARLYDRTRRNGWLAAATALAACAAISATLWALWPRALPQMEYPAPTISQGTVQTNGEAVARGARLETDDETAEIDLGHYVNVSMEPQTAMTIGGSEFEENVSLDHGQINVTVQKNKGKFDVIVGSATVHVTGTRFRVGVEDQLLEKENRIAKNMKVAVDDGSVVVTLNNKSPYTMVADSSGTEKLFEISSVPMKVRPQVGPATTRLSAPSKVPGTTPTTRSTPNTKSDALPARLLFGNRPVARQLQVVLAEGHIEMAGTLYRIEARGEARNAPGLYVLQAISGGNFLLFPQQTPLPNLPKILPVYVRVTWEGGKVIKVELDSRNDAKNEPKKAAEFH